MKREIYLSKRTLVHISLMVAFVGSICAASGTVFRYYLRSVVDISPMNPELLMGTLFLGKMDSASFSLGIFLHFLLGAGFALLYIKVFRIWKQTGWFTGIKVGIAHWLLSGLGLAFFLLGEKFLPKFVAPSGIFWNQMGSGIYS